MEEDIDGNSEMPEVRNSILARERGESLVDSADQMDLRSAPPPANAISSTDSPLLGSFYSVLSINRHS